MSRFALVIFVSVFATLAFARESVSQPVDPYSAGEIIDVLEHDHAGRYVELSAKKAVADGLGIDQQIAAVEAAVRRMMDHYAPAEQMTALSLMNSVLFELATQYRHHSPLREVNVKWIDSKSEQDLRRLAVEAAGLLMAAIANLPNEKFEINTEFRSQHSHSTPLMVLESYLSQPGNIDHAPFFANEHAPMLSVQIRRAQTKTGLVSRWRALFAEDISALRKSCSAFTSVKIPAQ